MRSWLAVVTTLMLILLPRAGSAASIVLDQASMSYEMGLAGTGLFNDGFSGNQWGPTFTAGVPGTLGSDPCSAFPGGGATGGCFPGGGNTGGVFPGGIPGGELPGGSVAGDTAVSSVAVPDAGSTLLLLGASLVGFAAWRKRRG